MYAGGMIFSINKSFGHLQLVPECDGLRLFYTPVVNGVFAPGAAGSLNLLLPIDAVGGLWATARAFLYGVESLDENVILQGGAPQPPPPGGGMVNEDSAESDILIKLYRDRPRGQQGKLSGEETCWLRLVTERSEEERRRIKLGPRDLMSLELACNSVMLLAAQKGSHRPKLRAA